MTAVFLWSSERIWAANNNPQSNQITIRSTLTLPDPAIELIANRSVPTKVPVASGVPPEEVIRAYCGGSVSETYLNLVWKLNPGILKLPSTGPRLLLLPACPRWLRNGQVVVGKGDTIETVLLREAGFSGDTVLEKCRNGGVGQRCGKTLRQYTSELNSGINIDKLAEGATLRLPVISKWISFTLKPTDPPSADPVKDFLAELTSKAQESVQIGQIATATPPVGVVSPLIVAQQAKPWQLIEPLSLEDVSNPACRDAAGKPATEWPFNADAVMAALIDNVEFARAAANLPGPTVVRIVDTGFYNVGTPGSIFRPEWLWKNTLSSPSGSRFGVSADGSGDLSPYDKYFPLHGTTVAIWALGGYGITKSVSNLGDYLRLNFVKAAKNKVAIQDAQSVADYEMDEASVLSSFSSDPLPHIVSMSLGTSNEPKNVPDLLRSYKNFLLVTAAGNDHVDLASTEFYPADYGGYGPATAEQVITVGAHDALGNLAEEFSNYGERQVDLIAPGCHIEYRPEMGNPQFFHGTSFATPIVTFTAALLRALGVQSPFDIKTRLYAAVDFDPMLHNVAQSSGRLNIWKSLNVYHDVLITDKDSPLGEKSLVGDWITDPGYTICEDGFSPEVLKVTPVKFAEGLQIRIVYRATPGHRMQPPTYCVPTSAGIKFKFKPQGASDDKILQLPWDQVIDIVPRHRW